MFTLKYFLYINWSGVSFLFVYCSSHWLVFWGGPVKGNQKKNKNPSKKNKKRERERKPFLPWLIDYKALGTKRDMQ